MKRIFWILVTPTLLLFLLGALFQFFIFPKVSDWALEQAQIYLKKEAHLDLTVGQTDISLPRLSVFLSQVEVLLPQKILNGPLQIEKIQVRLDPLALLLGRLKVSAIVIDQVNAVVNLDELPKDTGPTKDLPIDEIFKWTEALPIERVALRRAQLNLRSQKQEIEFKIKPLDALVTNHLQKISFKVFASSMTLHSKRLESDLNLSLETFLVLDRQRLQILMGQIMSVGQTLHLKGVFENPAKISTKPEGQFETAFSSDLAPLSENLRRLLKHSLPRLEGRISLESNFKINGWKSLTGEALIKTENVKVDEFDVGSSDLRAVLDHSTLKLPDIQIQHSSGHAKLKQTQLNLGSPFNFSSEIAVENLDLQKLFIALKLKSIPVWLQTQGDLNCAGQISDFKLECQGQVRGHDLVVKGGMKSSDNVIVDIPKAQADGSLVMDLQQIKIKSALKLGEDKGQVEGEVGYKTGFNFRFKSDSVNFKNIKNLANLQFVGEAQLDGSTSGDSHAATLDINTTVKDFIFEKYNLGTLTGHLRYAQGHLLLNDLNGHLPTTLYKGKIDIDLGHSAIEGSIEMPKTDLKDIASIFSQIYQLPIDLRADGQAQASFHGPLNFWKMSYNLQSSFKNGEVQGESFSSLVFNVHSQDGQILTDRAELNKGSSTLRLAGRIDSDRQAKLTLDGSNLRLEESELVNKIRSNVIGALNFNAEITGPITQPDIKAKGHLAELLVDEQELPGSFFQVHLSPHWLEGEANLFGNKIQGEFKIPLAESQNGLRIKAKTTDWNFSSVLGFFGASQLQTEYESNLTSEIDLSNDTADWTALSGSILIKQVFLKRGNSSVKNSDPIEVRFQKGNINLRKFNLTGANTSIQLRGENFSFRKLNLSLQAQSDLRLVHIFLPFLDDLGGPFSTEANISGSYDKPEVLGNAKFENAFIKIHGFPHMAEKLRADVVFSHSKILIQNIKGFLAGGTLAGDGSVSINGIRDIPTNIRLRADGLNLHVPEKVRTQGNAQLVFSGRWFPFILSGTYNVQSGRVEMEFESEQNNASQIKESVYLPKVLKEASFDPVLLDLQVNIERNLAVKNQTVDGSVTGQLQVKGPPQNPTIFGKLNIEKNSRLVFKSNIFEVQTGSVTFNNPDEINPEVYLTAQSRVSDYDINLLVQGPAKKATIKLSSLPPLPDQEIISLLALGVTSEKLDQNVQSKDQATRVGYEAAAGILQEIGVGRGLQSAFGVNFELTSSFDSTKNSNVPKVTFSKKLSRRWSTSYSQGIDQGQGSKEVKLRYQINTNLSAVGSWEGREAEGTSVQAGTRETQSVLGLDLEFKREFK